MFFVLSILDGFFLRVYGLILRERQFMENSNNLKQLQLYFSKLSPPVLLCFLFFRRCKLDGLFFLLLWSDFKGVKVREIYE